MTIRSIAIATCAIAGLPAAFPAAAACSLATQPIAVKMATSRPMLDAKINGKVGHFLLDSGTAVNLMASKFAGSQKLTASRTSDNGPSVVKAPTFEFAGATLKDAPFVVEDRLVDVDGVIGQTILRQGDVEYDLSAGAVKLAKAVGCEGANMAYWAKEGDLFWEAELTPTDKDTPFTKTDVVINGVKLRGIFSTGKTYTTITEKAAAKANVKISDASVKPLGSNGKSWMGTFGSVIIGNEETKSAPLEIDRTDDEFYDVLIGADFFSTHHLYVANSQQKVYFTRAGIPGPVFKAHPPQAIGMNAGDASRGRLSDHYSPGSYGGTKE